MPIRVCSYTKTIKGITVLDAIECTFEQGRIYGLQGKNGSGKTMLLRAIAGLILPTSGHVEIDGKIVGVDIAFPPSIGLLIENPSFISRYTGAKNLELLAGLKGIASADHICNVLRQVGLDPTDARTYRKYSLGMKQRLGIACAIMENPSIVLLDEPFNALDPSGVSCVMQAIAHMREQGSTTIVACHDVEELRQISDEIITLAEGRVVSREKVGS